MSLADTPAQLQHMLLCLQGYDYVLHYCPGKEMTLPIHCHVSIPNLALRLPWILPSTMPTYPLSKKEAFQLAFEMDVEMHTLADIISDWPSNIKEVPHQLCPYWQHHDSIAVEDGLMFCGEALIIPPSEMEKVLGTLHQSHQSITKTQLLFCGYFLCPGINKAIEEDVWQCETCMRY